MNPNPIKKILLGNKRIKIRPSLPGGFSPYRGLEYYVSCALLLEHCQEEDCRSLDYCNAVGLLQFLDQDFPEI